MSFLFRLSTPPHHSSSGYLFNQLPTGCPIATPILSPPHRYLIVYMPDFLFAHYSLSLPLNPNPPLPLPPTQLAYTHLIALKLICISQLDVLLSLRRLTPPTFPHASLYTDLLVSESGTPRHSLTTFTHPSLITISISFFRQSQTATCRLCSQAKWIKG